jgi:hypothetical protein
MRKTLVVLALLAATTAHAEYSPEITAAIQSGEISSNMYSGCVLQGVAASVATSIRDTSLPPQTAYEYAKRAAMDRVDDQTLKTMVNVIYFEPAFAQYDQQQMQEIVSTACLNPHHKYSKHYDPVQ